MTGEKGDSVAKPRDLAEAIRKHVLPKDGRFPLEAYRFLYESLDHTIQRLGERRHVTGRELLEGIRDLALRQFGPLARMVFDRWNVRRTEDFGDMVFNLVDAGLMSRQETDSREDFAGGFDFDEAFQF
jgi:uncharacterized repeat protein (TIGR04138 family)